MLARGEAGKLRGFDALTCVYAEGLRAPLGPPAGSDTRHCPAFAAGAFVSKTRPLLTSPTISVHVKMLDAMLGA